MFQKIKFKTNQGKIIFFIAITLFLLLAIFARGGSTSADKHSFINLSCDPGNLGKFEKIACFKLQEYGKLDYGQENR